MLTEAQISQIVEQVVSKLAGSAPAAAPQAAAKAEPERISRFTPLKTPSSRPAAGARGIFEKVEHAVAAASFAYQEYREMPLSGRQALVAAIRAIGNANAEAIGKLAVSETKLGRTDDKIKKVLNAINQTPGTEDLNTVAWTGDHGLTLTEYAPFGVIASVTPCTNPAETIFNNGIGFVAAGNAAVFNPHPLAKGVSVRTVELINEAIVKAGGPENLLSCIREPTIDSAGDIMKHAGIRMVVVTGGPAVVRAAMGSGKKVIAAGPGNPPCVVDETANIAQAARDFHDGASFDNNIVCIVEKEAIVVASVADQFKKHLRDYGAYELNDRERAALEKVVVSDGHANKDWVGKDAAEILAQIGVKADKGCRLIFAETDENHPFVQLELLMPVVGVVRVPDVDEAIAMAVRVEHGYGHTATMHSMNVTNLHNMAVAANTSIFVKNGPSYAGLGIGGEGFTSYTISTPTGEGLTSAKNFCRVRRCTLKDHFRIV